jgi:hypothetical protein
MNILVIDTNEHIHEFRKSKPALSTGNPGK